jgi:hypothetical protein
MIGLLTIYAAFLAATNLNTGVAQLLLNVQPFIASADSRLYAYLGVMAVVILAVEGLAAGYHDRLQVAVVLMNRFTGLLIGLVTGVLLAGFGVYVFNGYANPTGGTLTDTQVKVRSAFTTSALGPVVLRLVLPVRPLFAVALPVEPQTFFTTAHE